MGNKIGRRRHVIDEKYTRPQGLYQLRDIDHKKLRKLILDSKLAPCYPGGDDDGRTLDLEECPICFLFFPSLNRSKCCSKGICTECFLQMKPSHPARPSQCPYCKTSNYAVEYRGAKTKEEKGVERIEEQRVIEAKIRMRQQELQDEKRKLRKKEEQSSSSRSLPLAEVEYQDVFSGSYSARCFRYSVQDDEAVSSQGSCSDAVSGRPSHSRQNREDNFDLDLENRMIMQAIWQSIQEQGIQRSPSPCSISSNLPLQHPLFSENCFTCNATFSSEPSPPPLSHPHHMCGGSMDSMSGNIVPNSGMLQCSPVTFSIANWNTGTEQSSRLLPNAPNRWMLIDHHDSNIMEVDMNYSGMDSSHVISAENFEETGARMSSQERMWL